MFAAAIFFATATFSRKETVTGLLQPVGTVARIAYPRPAVVRAVHVREGQMVKAGDPLFTLALDQHLSGGGTLGERLGRATNMKLSALSQQQNAALSSAAAQQRELAARIDDLAEQRASLLRDGDIQRQRMALLETSLKGYLDLAAKGFVSQNELRSRQSEVLALRLAVSDLSRRAQEAASEITASQAQRDRSQASAMEMQASLDAQFAQLERESADDASLQGIVLTAPVSGKVVTLRARPGSSVNPEAVLAMVIPADTRLEAELWVPSRAIGLVRPGNDVRLMYDAFPFERFGSAAGRIVDISTTPVEANQLPVPSETREAMYRVRVAIGAQSVQAYGKQWPLTPGSQLRADVILERQSLLDWLLAPVRATQTRLAQ